MQSEDLVMFSKARKLKELEEEQFKIQGIRWGMYDRIVKLVEKVC